MAESYADDTATRGLTADEKLLSRAKACFKQGTKASDAQRARENKALRFYAGDQWDPAVKRAREGTGGATDGVGALPPLPPRPTITINKVKDPVRQVVNQQQDAEIGVEIVAADDFEELSPAIDDPEIALREGLVRRIQRHSEAEAARSWAFSRAAICGTGWYRILTRYVPRSRDKELYIDRIYDQASVVADPAHESPNGSDCEWIIIGSDVPWERYASEYPKAEDGEDNPLLSYSDEEFRTLHDQEPEWFMSDDPKLRMCRVVEYFYVTRTSETLCELEDGRVVPKDELPEGVTVPDEHTWIEVTKQIKWVKLDGVQILERTDWEGPDMPFIKVVCEEVQPYDSEKRAQGIVEPAMGANEGFNAVASKFLESYALAPAPTIQATPQQIEPFKAWYQARTTRVLPYLPYAPHVIGGTVLPEPHMLDVNIGPTISALTMGLQMFSEAVSTTTGVDSQLSHLGHSDPALKSGRAIQALQAQQQQGTSGPIANFKRSVSYEGHVLNNLLYPIYGTKPGRLLRIVTGQGETDRVRLAGADSQPQVPQGQGQSGQPVYRLTPDAKFNVIINVAPKVTDRRQQEVATLGEIISAQPQMMGVFGDLFFKYQDGPGHQEMAERAKVMLAPAVQQLLAQKAGQSNIPPEVAAQMAKMGQQIQQIEQIAHAQQQELQSKHAELASKERIATAEIQSKERMAAADRETKLAVAELGAKVDRLQLFVTERNRVGLQLTDQAHEATQAELDRQHERTMGVVDKAHDAALAQTGQDAAAESQGSQQAHEAMLAEQQAQAQADGAGV